MNIAAKTLVTAVLISSTFALGGCANLPFGLPGERTSELPAGKGLILFNADTVGNAPAKRIQYSDNEQRVDYALFKGPGDRNGAQAEFIYMETKTMVQVAFDFSFTIMDKVQEWRLNKNQPVKWEKAVLLRTAVGDVFYKPYRLTKLNRQCFGVSGEWEMAVNDSELRHTRILFGYYCAPPGQALSNKEMASLTDRIGLRGMTQRSLDYADRIMDFHGDVKAHYGDAAAAAKAMKTVQGIDAPELAGIGEFPFRYAAYYTDGPDSDLVN